MRKFLKVLKFLFIFGFIICLLGGIAVSAYTYNIISNAEAIDPKNIYEELDKNSYIYDSKGKIISTLYADEDRNIIKIDEMPENLVHAFVAIEDKTFYEHKGINVKRTIGAIVQKLMGKSESISGTSTITQQLARNVYLPDIKSERSIQRKIVELYYALLIEKDLSKDEIMEAYLNTVYFGYQNYGIETAAKSYFSKDVEDLTLEECAALAALPQAPDTYALLKDEEGDNRTKIKKTKLYANDISKERRDLVLDLMVDQGYITKEEADGARKDLIDFINPDLSGDDNKYTYFNDYVLSTVIDDLMAKYDLDEDTATKIAYTGGLHIYTPLDSKIQGIIYKEFKDDDNYPWAAEEPQSAMVVCDVKTGQVKAMVGGRKTSGKKLFNRAVSPRQPGSSIKPLAVYSAALQKSYELEKQGKQWDFVDYKHDKQGAKYGSYITAGSRIVDEKMYFDGNIWPYNVTRTFTGNQTFRSAVQQSINTCAVKIQLQVGTDYSIKMLKKYGISTLVEDGDTNDLNPASMALGAMTKGVTPLDMALAYAAFPNKGIRNSAVCYTKVVDAEGNVLLTGESEKTKVMDEGVAWIMTDVLKSVVKYNGIAILDGVEAGGKTGTTNDCYDIWFDGFTPKYSAALWIGTDHNKELSTMSTSAAALWRRIMNQIPDITEGEYPDQPSNVIYQRGEYYTEGTEPNVYRY